MKTAALFFLALVLAAMLGCLQWLPPTANAQEQPYTLENLRQYQVQYTNTLVNTGTSPVARQDVWIPIPVGNLNQRVLNVAFNPQPTEFLVDNWGQQIAHYVVTNMAEGSSLDIRWTADIQVSDISFSIDPTVGLEDVPSDILTTYTADDERFLITDPVVVAAAEAAIGSETTLYGKVVSIFQYIVDHMSYEMEGSTDNAPTVLARGNGSCSEYAHATMALLRANGIPCRILGGTRTRSGIYDNYTDTVFHRTVEVYLPKHGWVPFDTGLGDTKRQPIFTRCNNYLVFHVSGGRSSILRSHYISRLKVADTTVVTRSAHWTENEITLDRPPAVTTNDAIEGAGSSARLNGNLAAMGSAPSVAVSFEYGTAPAIYSGETTPELKMAAWDFSCSLDGLSPGLTYYYRAKAVGNGTAYGTEKSFTAGTTPPAVTTNDATDITTNAACLNGDLTSMGTGTSVTVSFLWGTTSGSYPNETVAQARMETGAYKYNLGGLKPRTTYYYKARAVGDGTRYGVEKSFATGTGADRTPPSTPRVTDDGESTTATATIHATWRSVDTESGIAEYWYAVGTTAGSNDVVDWTSARTTTEKSIASLSLTPGQTYYVSVKAVNGHGLWSAVGTSDGITVSADEAEPTSNQQDKAGVPFRVWILVAVGAVGVGSGGFVFWRSRKAKAT